MRYIVCFLSAFMAVYLETGGMNILAVSCSVIPGQIIECTDCSRHYLIALCGLFFLWAFLKTYYKERAMQKPVVPPEDLALLKIIETNAQIICQKYRPHQNVVNIEDWRK